MKSAARVLGRGMLCQPESFPCSQAKTRTCFWQEDDL